MIFDLKSGLSDINRALYWLVFTGMLFSSFDILCLFLGLTLKNVYLGFVFLIEFNTLVF